jgi:hypothetical protein
VNAPLRRLARQAGFTLLASLLVLGGTLLSSLSWLGTPAGASTTPPWEPDPSSVGGLVFYNASGQAITGGNVTDSPIAAYVQGTATVRSGDTVATLYGYLPVNGQMPTLWSGEQLGLTTTFPNTSAPPPLNTSTLPLETGTAGDESLQTLEADFPNNDHSDDGYAGMYQLRLYTNAPHHSQTTLYDSADILISGSSWTVVYPAPPTSTATTLTASPASPQPVGTQETLTATISPSAAPGTVQFQDNGTNIGSPVTVSGGTAQFQTSSLPVGTDQLSAVFTPTGGSGYGGSTGNLSFTVNSATSTSTTLTASPASPQQFGTQETLTATISPSAAPGTVQFEDNGTDIGSAVTVSGGMAQTQTSSLPVGTDQLSAVFTPTGSGYSGSTGNLSFTVNPITTSTSLSVSPASPQPEGTQETLTATITPSAAPGKVQFQVNGSNLGSPVTVSGGSAQTQTSSLPSGTDSLSAVFTPTTGSGYAGSTGGPQSFTVTAAPTTTTLTASPASPQQFGTNETLTATVSPSAASGKVQFENDGTNLGSPVTVTGGTAQFQTSSLPVGTDSLSAVFTPTTGNGYSGSTGGPQSFTVNPITTSTSLGASPPSPQFAGTLETLTATISPSAAPGTVQFEDNGTDIGSPATVTGGTAQFQTSSLPVGTDSLSAVFTPTSGSGYGGSTGGPLSFTVNSVISTTTSLTALPASPQQFATVETLTATISPSAATGTVQFQDNGTDVGSPATVSGGTAQFETSGLPVGTDSLSAIFTPKSGSGYGGSTGGPLSFTVTAISTTTTLLASPASPQFAGTDETLTATISPSAATGTVQFEVGSTNIGSPASVSGGVAHIQTSALPVGTDSLSAKFTPTAGNGYSGSTGGPLSFTVNPLTPTTTTLTASPASPQEFGTQETLTATISPSAAPGRVQFEANGSDIGDAVTVSAGTAKVETSSLAAGTDALSAVFIPTNGSGYGGSTGTASFTVAGHAGNGYWLVGSDGSVHNYGDAANDGSASSMHLNAPIVGAASTPDGKGYWLAASDGGVFTFGDALFYGSAGGIHLNAPIVGIAATPDGKGYWLVAADGGVFTYGDALFYGSAGGIHLNKPVVGIAATPDGKGYWLAASDGGVFTYGDAGFHGSAGGIHLNKPVVGIAATADGNGYWLAASDGGVFTYGDAAFDGSAGSIHLDAPVVGIGSTSDGKGYWLFGADGGVFTYGDAPFFGSGGGTHLGAPIVGEGIE